MNVLVTGANGFVGAMLCRKLLDKNYNVYGLVRKTSDLTLLQDLPVKTITGSLQDPKTLRNAVYNIHTIYHVAAAVSDWGSLSWFRSINVDGTRALLGASIDAGATRFVLVSTVAVHAFLGNRNMDENSPQIPNPFPYGISKQEAEHLVLQYYKEKKIDVTIVRPGDVFGPGDRTSLLKMKDMLLKGQMLYLNGGRRLGAFTYVENLCAGIILAGTSKQAIGETYIITDGYQLTWREYFERLTIELNLPRHGLSIPAWLAMLIAVISETLHRLFGIKKRPLITRYLVAHLKKDFHFSIQKAMDELGYHPQISLDEAIHRTAKWFRECCMEN